MQYIDKMMGLNSICSVQVGNKVYTALRLGHAQRKLTETEAKISLTLMNVQPLNLRNEALTNSAKQINDAMKGGIKKMIKTLICYGHGKQKLGGILRWHSEKLNYRRVYLSADQFQYQANVSLKRSFQTFAALLHPLKGSLGTIWKLSFQKPRQR